MNEYLKLTSVEFNGWPSSNRIGLLEVDLSPEQFEERYGLIFNEASDSLDDYFHAHVFEPCVGSVVLLFYKNNPSKTTSIFVDSKVDLKKSIDAIVELFNFNEEDVLWKKV